MVFTAVALTLALLAPQDPPGDPRLTSVLKASEIKKLNGLAVKWFQARQRYDEETEAQSLVKLSQLTSRAKEKFINEWEKRDAPLQHVGDVLAVFANVFDYDNESGTGEMRLRKEKGALQDYYAAIPRGYRGKEAMRCLLQLPAREDDATISAEDFYEATWKGTEFAESTLVLAPQMPETALDYLGDLSTPDGDARESDYIRAVLGAAGEAQRQLNMDRGRLILDCGEGAGAFGLRLASYFPARFAGVIVRHPVDMGAFRMASLGGMSVCLISSAETAEAAGKIKEALDALEPGACTVLEAEGEAPYGGMHEAIGKWAEGVERDLFRSKVTWAPNNDRFRKAYWVTVPLFETAFGPAELQPFLSAEADRDSNTIRIEAKNITEVSLFLNDALIDLDKEFTVVVNGKALTEKLERNFHNMTDWMFNRFDPGYMFTTTYTTAVPEAQ